MKFADIFFLSIRNFRFRFKRTLITILGMGLGVAIIVFLVSLGYGLQHLLLGQITTSESLSTISVFSPNSDVVSLNQKTINEISKINNVVEVSPLASFSGGVSIGEAVGEVTVYGVKSSFFRLTGKKVIQGKFFTKNESKKIVISSAAAKLFNLDLEQSIGQKVNLYIVTEKQKVPTEKTNVNENASSPENYFEKELEVVGVVDNNLPIVYVSLNDLNGIKISKYDQIEVKVTNVQALENVRDKISGLGYLTSSISDTIKESNRIFKIIKILLATFGSISLLIAAIGMFNTMTVTLLEKTGEIGIMKAIGASSKTISISFLIEATIIGFLGGISGLIIGILGGRLFNLILNLIGKMFNAQSVNIFYTPLWFAGIIVITSTIIGFVTSIYPARQAAKMDPLDALRYK